MHNKKNQLKVKKGDRETNMFMNHESHFAACYLLLAY